MTNFIRGLMLVLVIGIIGYLKQRSMTATLDKLSDDFDLAMGRVLNHGPKNHAFERGLKDSALREARSRWE